MTYNAVFDESGKWNDSKTVVFAGLVGDQSKLTNPFSVEWNRSLKAANIPGTETKEGWPFFHTVALVRRYKRFSTASQKETIERLFETASNLISECFIEGWANAITIEAFKALPQETRVKYVDPYYFAFDAGVTQLAKSVSLGPDDTLNLICDDSEEYAGQSLRCYRRLKRNSPAVAKRIPAISFVDDRSFAPLQAADLFAYCWRAKTSGATEGLWSSPLATMLAKFSEHGTFDIRI